MWPLFPPKSPSCLKVDDPYRSPSKLNIFSHNNNTRDTTCVIHAFLWSWFFNFFFQTLCIPWPHTQPLYHITSLCMYFIGWTVKYNESYTPIMQKIFLNKCMSMCTLYYGTSVWEGAGLIQIWQVHHKFMHLWSITSPAPKQEFSNTMR